MPRKLAGHTHITVEIPDGLLARARAKRGTESLTALLCRLLAKECGAQYTAPKRGRPLKNPPGSVALGTPARNTK